VPPPCFFVSVAGKGVAEAVLAGVAAKRVAEAVLASVADKGLRRVRGGAEVGFE